MWSAWLALSLVATACSGSASPAASSRTTPPGSVTPSTTSVTNSTAVTGSASTAATTAATTSTSTVASTTTEPPPVVIPEEEWVTTIETLMARITAANFDPANADIAAFCVPDSDCWLSYEFYFNNLVDDGTHMIGLPPTLVESIGEVVDASTLSGNQDLPPDTQYQVTYTLAPMQPGGQLVDADGNVLVNVAEPDPNPATLTRLFSRFPDDPEAPWRFVDN